MDMAKVKARKDGVMLSDRTGVESWLDDMNSCTVIRGHARFEDPHTVRVDGEVISADRIFLNVGGRAVAAWGESRGRPADRTYQPVEVTGEDTSVLVTRALDHYQHAIFIELRADYYLNANVYEGPDRLRKPPWHFVTPSYRRHPPRRPCCLNMGCKRAKATPVHRSGGPGFDRPGFDRQ